MESSGPTRLNSRERVGYLPLPAQHQRLPYRSGLAGTKVGTALTAGG